MIEAAKPEYLYCLKPHLVLWFFLLRNFQTIRQKIFYVLVSLLAFLPGLYLGRDYYPRFEFISVVTALAAYCVLAKQFRRDALSIQTFKAS